MQVTGVELRVHNRRVGPWIARRVDRNAGHTTGRRLVQRQRTDRHSLVAHTIPSVTPNRVLTVVAANNTGQAPSVRPRRYQFDFHQGVEAATIPVHRPVEDAQCYGRHIRLSVHHRTADRIGNQRHKRAVGGCCHCNRGAARVHRHRRLVLRRHVQRNISVVHVYLLDAVARS